MELYDIPEYIEDIQYVGNLDLPWNKLENRAIMISGATGLIGSFLVDVLLFRNQLYEMNCHIIALGRDERKVKKRFGQYAHELCFIPYDVSKPFDRADINCVDYILHLASNTHPIAYSTDPIGTIMTNVVGTANMLDFAVDHHATRCAFASSNEVYGENRGDIELFDEKYCGYIDSNTLRAGYPESKRCGEALCQAYIRQRGLDIVIPRLTRTYGPTMLMSDTKASSQFIKKALAGEDIVLKSAGTQYYSYTYVADAVSGLLYVLLCGEKGEAYNIADESSDIMLKDFALILAKMVGKEVIFELPAESEKEGYSKATKARLNNQKLRSLGWKANYDIRHGIARTVLILKEIN